MKAIACQLGYPWIVVVRPDNTWQHLPVFFSTETNAVMYLMSIALLNNWPCYMYDNKLYERTDILKAYVCNHTFTPLTTDIVLPEAP